MRFKLWVATATLKWIVLLVAIPFAYTFPPPVWVSVCWLVFMFGHFATEYFFPGGFRALEEVSRQPFHRRLSLFLYIPGLAGLLLVFCLSFAARRDWFARTELRIGAFTGLALVGIWWIAFVVHRDFLIARHWPHEPIA